jgi:hypothetical protein
MNQNKGGRDAPRRFWLPVAALAAAGLLVLGPATVWAKEPDAAQTPDRLALGINNMGGQIRLHLNPDWATEARFMTGSASSNAGNISALVFGLRGYRFFTAHHRFRLYLGLEGDFAQTSIRSVSENSGVNGNGGISSPSGFGDTTGYDAGAFGGIEFRVFRRVAIDFDMGPYLINLKEKVTSTAGSSWDFVANTAVIIYLF